MNYDWFVWPNTYRHEMYGFDYKHALQRPAVHAPYCASITTTQLENSSKHCSSLHCVFGKITLVLSTVNQDTAGLGFLALKTFPHLCTQDERPAVEKNLKISSNWVSMENYFQFAKHSPFFFVTIYTHYCLLPRASLLMLKHLSKCSTNRGRKTLIICVLFFKNSKQPSHLF